LNAGPPNDHANGVCIVFGSKRAVTMAAPVTVI
jgi:hypothetical protein